MRNSTRRSSGCAFGGVAQGLLRLDRALHGVDRARKLGEHAVAGRVGDTAAMPRDGGVQDGPLGRQHAHGADLVGVGQAAESGHIGGKNRGKSAFDTAVLRQCPALKSGAFSLRGGTGSSGLEAKSVLYKALQRRGYSLVNRLLDLLGMVQKGEAGREASTEALAGATDHRALLFDDSRNVRDLHDARGVSLIGSCFDSGFVDRDRA